MAGVDATRAVRFEARIDPEENLDDLTPVCAIGGGVEQARVQADMRPIIVGQRLARRGAILEMFDHRSGFVSPQHALPDVNHSKMFVQREMAWATPRGVAAASRGSGRVMLALAIMDQQDSVSSVGRQEHDAVGLEGSPDLIARRFVDVESAFGLKALQGG